MSLQPNNHDDKTSLEHIGMSARLQNCLTSSGYLFLEDIPLDLSSLNAVKGMGKTTIDELNQLLIRFNRISSVQTMPSPEIQVLEYPFLNDSHNMFDEIEKLLFTWYSYNKNKDEYQVIWQRYGIGDNKEATLNDIGIYLGLTNERVRQIEIRDIKRITYLLNGHIDPVTKTQLSNQITAHLLDIKKRILIKDFIELEEFKKTYSTLYGMEIKQQQIGILRLILKCYNYSLILKTSPCFIVSSNCMNGKDFLAFIDSIYTYLKNEPEPVKEFDLIKSVKKLLNKKDLQNSTIIQFCTSNPYISFYNKDNETLYELNQIHMLKSVIKMYRVLRENNDVMHIRDITGEIKKRQFEETGKKGSVAESTNLLSSSDLFSPIGKTGKWALSKWNIASHSIPELIQEYLDRQGSPVSTSELLTFIKLNPGRETTDTQTLCTILHQHKDRFYRTENGMVTTAQRSMRKNNQCCKHMSSDDIYNTIKALFDAQGSDTLPRSVFFEHLNKTSVVPSTIYAIIKRQTYLMNMSDDDSTLMIRFNRDNKFAPKKRTSEIRTQIISKITDFLNHAPQKTLPLSELSEKVAYSLRCNKPYIYRIINEIPQFIKSGTDLKEQVISLSDYKIKDLQEDGAYSFEEEIKKLIQEGENLTVEFKSTLRWDIREQRLNKDLELAVSKNICAFANTIGGNLLIGVEDDGTIFGLEQDYKIMGNKGNRDGFLLHISNMFNTLFGNAICALVTTEIGVVDNKDICRIKVQQSSEPVFMKDSIFYIRSASSARELNPKETVEYIRHKFKR